jgi:hypothetical protein
MIKPAYLTRIICTVAIFFLALYDAGILMATHSIDASVSAWFGSFGCYFMPVFGMAFLLGHFFGNLPKKGVIHTKMARTKLIITTSVIILTLYDVTVLQFFKPEHAFSSVKYVIDAGQYPIINIIAGVIAGKYLGRMSPVRPAGDKI